MHNADFVVATDVQCRSCGRFGLTKILSLKEVPLSLTAQASSSTTANYWPIELAWCPECSLVQASKNSMTDGRVRESTYFASLSPSLVEQAREIAGDLTSALKLDANSLVIEVGSNDGYLLQWYQKVGIPVLGIEPALNIARMAEAQKKVRTISEPFTKELGQRLRKQQQADVVHASDVLSNATDLNDAIAGLKELLKPDGVLVVEEIYVRGLFDDLNVDLIQHERSNYFSLTALDRAFRRQGLMVCEVEKPSRSTMTMRIFARHLSNIRPAMSVVRQLAQEDQWVYRDTYYRQFADRLEDLRSSLSGLLQRLKSQRKRVAVYGATSRRSSLINYLGIDAETHESASTDKVSVAGNSHSGPHLTVHAPEELLRDKPDYCLLLDWERADDILRQHQQYREQGGKFIIPYPTLRVA